MARVQSLAKELRSRMRCNVAKTNRKHWMAFLPPKRYKRPTFFMKNISLWGFHFCPFHNPYNVFFLMSFFLAEKHINRNSLKKKKGGCGKTMSVMSPVTSNGRKIPTSHFILKKEWKFKDHFN